MKIVEPISRMKRETDRSQKTIVILLGLFGLIPTLVNLARFENNCIANMAIAYNDVLGANIRWGAGAVCFLLSLLIQPAIYAIHITIPSCVTTAHDSTSPPASPSRVSPSYVDSPEPGPLPDEGFRTRLADAAPSAPQVTPSRGRVADPPLTPRGEALDREGRAGHGGA